MMFARYELTFARNIERCGIKSYFLVKILAKFPTFPNKKSNFEYSKLLKELT